MDASGLYVGSVDSIKAACKGFGYMSLHFLASG
jgi:hypothetical protein